MKPILILITICLTVLSIGTCFSQTFATIHTKGGKAIEVKIYPDFSGEYKQAYNEEYQKRFPNATMLASSTPTYNCHSYAWNISDGGDTICWINKTTSDNKPNIANYWTNDYYSETTESNAQKVHYYLSDHSAIVSATVPGMYESKWGAMPLMRHAPGYGPYPNMDSRKYYAHFSTPTTPSVKYGLIKCSNGDGLIGVNVAAGYSADMGSYSYSKMICTIETAKGDDAVAEGYAVINDTSENGVNVTFTRAGIYEMYLRFYNSFNQLVGEFTFEPIVTEN